MRNYDIKQSLEWEVVRHRYHGHMPVGGRDADNGIWIIAGVVWLAVVLAVVAQYGF